MPRQPLTHFTQNQVRQRVRSALAQYNVAHRGGTKQRLGFYPMHEHLVLSATDGYNAMLDAWSNFPAEDRMFNTFCRISQLTPDYPNTYNVGCRVGGIIVVCKFRNPNEFDAYPIWLGDAEESSYLFDIDSFREVFDIASISEMARTHLSL